VQAQVYDLEEKRVAAADQVARIDVKAPTSGRVLGLTVHTVGGVVKPGEDLLNIVPDNDALIIQAKVKPNDIEHISRGQTAEVRFTGLSRRTTPVLLGEVVTVSADHIVDKAGAEPYYEVRIAIPDEQMKLITGAEIVPGMPTEVMIETGKRSPLAFLLAPIADNVVRAFGE
jgi:HlyD family type I secretion membrane fusion protein